MESEYTTLSMAFRAFTPLQAAVKLVVQGLHYTKAKEISFNATVHEDNQGALIPANLEPGRTTIHPKLYALKLHWFHSWVVSTNQISIVFINSNKNQKALTSSLNHCLH
eukprot:jgi/Psemu1/26839/gm1.26839_g